MEFPNAVFTRATRHAGYAVAESPKAHPGGLRPAQGGGRTAQDEADRSGETGRTGAAVFCRPQPGAHRQPVGRAGCQACMGRRPPGCRHKASTRLPKRPAEGQNRSDRSPAARKPATSTPSATGGALSLCVFQRPARPTGWARVTVAVSEFWRTGSKPGHPAVVRHAAVTD